MNTPLAQLVGNRVKELREQQGWSQEQLATMIRSSPHVKDFKQPAVGHIETGRNLPSVQVLNALAVALETSTDYLLGLTDNPTPQGDWDDQVIATIEDEEERQTIQELLNLVARSPREEKLYIADLIKRIIPKPPRIIGGE